MKLYEIYVPCGFSLSHHKKWDKIVLELAGGLTLFRPINGKWVDDKNITYDEGMIPVRIACEEDKMFEIAKITKRHYNQKAIFFCVIANDVFFVS